MIVNGNLKFHTAGQGELQNAMFERKTRAAINLAGGAVDLAGRVYYDTTDKIYYYSDGTNWVAFATGGNAADLQTEVNNIETTIGPYINNDGTFNEGGVTITNVTNPTSITNVLQQLGAAITGKDALEELTDVGTWVSLASSDILQYNGTRWINKTLTDAGVQPIDAALTNLSVGGTGFVTMSGDTVTWHTLTAGAAGLQGINIVGGNGSVVPTIGLSISGLTNDGGPLSATDVFPMFDGTNNLKVALSVLANSIGDNLTLNELSDVTIATPAEGHVLSYDFTNSIWINREVGAGSGVQPYDAGLTALAAAGTGAVSMDGDNVYFRTLTAPAAGITVSNGNGVAGNPTLALANDLASVEGMTAAGMVVRISETQWDARTLTAPAAGFTITNPAGALGNPTFALANDLAAYEGLGTYGYVVRTNDGTATTRSIAGTTDRVVVTNGSGVDSDTSIDLATVTQASSGDFRKVTLDSYGRVTGNTAVVTADITALVDATYVNIAGDTMTGDLTMTANTKIILPTPTGGFGDTNAVNKAYVDSLTTGLTWKNAVQTASTGNLTLSGEQTVDGYALVAGDRVLVKNQTAPADNGIYVVAAGGWTRSLDLDSAAESEHATTFALHGTVNANTGWTTLGATTLGTSAMDWVQFNGAAGVTAGIGLAQTGNTLYVNLGAGIAQLPTDEVGIDLFSTTGALLLTEDGTTQTDVTGAKLALLLDSAGALAQTTSGLKINANSVTNDMLFNEYFVVNSDSASPANVALGSALEVKGTSAQGIVTSHVAGVVTITASNASASQKGVATFNAADFTVSGLGDVTIKALGVGNAQLENDHIEMAGTGGINNQHLALGEVFSIVGGSTPITTVMTTDQLAINVATATTTTLGLARFATADFDVTVGGEVSIKAGSVANADLVNSTITIAGTSGSDAVALGETLTFLGGSTPVSAAVTANTVTISVADASTTAKGLAQFSDSFFSTASGVVSLAATLSDLTDVDTSTDAPAQDSILAWDTNTWKAVDPTTVLDAASIDDLGDVTITSGGDGDVLIHNGTAWVNQKVYYLYDGSTAATVHTVTHSLGQKYCNVTVVDASDEVIIPQSIKFDSTTALTVTFNAAIACKVIVMGLA